ncbi:diaminopimelate epimerase [soil metagenome]
MTVWPMSGAGNTFAVIDNRSTAIPLSTLQSIAPSLCDRSTISLRPAEGVLVLQRVDGHSFEGDFINPDGSYGAMCGNGGRCIVRFAIARGCTPLDDNSMEFTLSTEPYHAHVIDADHVSITFAAPQSVQEYAIGALQGVDVPVVVVDVRSDHAVLRASDFHITPENFRSADLAALALPIRHHAAFERGVNVNLYMVDAQGVIQLRTFERGVEAETGACGTGALSTALTTALRGECGHTVSVQPPSGRMLHVTLLDNSDGMILEGDALFDAPPTEFNIDTRVYQ